MTTGTAIENPTLIGSRIMALEDDEFPNDDALRLALMDYGNTVLDMQTTHIWKPYLQVVEEDDGNYLWWLAYAADLAQPDARIMKVNILRDYIMQVEMKGLDMEDDRFDVFDDDDLAAVLAEIDADLEATLVEAGVLA